MVFRFYTLRLTLSLFGVAVASPVATTPGVRQAGVNLFGLANDISILGSAYNLFESPNCNATFDAYPYFDPPSHYYDWHRLGFNLFRLPMAWQHIQESLGGPLNQTTFAGGLDTLIDTITGNGSTAIIDIHNYARYYCSIIGQPENDFLSNLTVTNEDFVDLWTKLALKYKDNDKLMFQLMNEPHDLNMTEWATTTQKAINAIRAANATQQILISGTQFARLTDWPDYSLAALSTITDPADNLLYDFHQYFDDEGGAYGVCEPWETFLPKFQWVTNFLRGSGRKGILTEFGGAPVPACVELFESLLEFMDDNADVWVGWTAWGSFNPGDLYLSLDPQSSFSLLTNVLKRFVPLK